MRETNEHIFEKFISDHQKPVILEVSALWSGCSHLMNDILEETESVYGDKLEFLFMDFDKNREYMISMNIQWWELPVIMFYYNGEQKIRFSGLKSKESFIKTVADFLKSFPEIERSSQ